MKTDSRRSSATTTSRNLINRIVLYQVIAWSVLILLILVLNHYLSALVQPLTAQLILHAVVLVLGLVGIYWSATTIIRGLSARDQMYQDLVEHMGEGLGLVDKDETFFYANPAAGQIFGLTAQGLIGRNLREFVSDEEWRKVRQQTEHRRRGEAASYELTIERPDGEYRYLEVTATPSLDSRGYFLGTYGIVTDITDRKLAEQTLQQLNLELEARVEQRTEELQQSEERYRRLVEMLPDAIIIESAGQIVYANQAAADLIGAPDPAALVGRQVMDFILPEEHEATRELMARIYQQSDQVHSVMGNLVRLDGGKAIIDVRALPIQHQGQPALLAINRDNTERRRAELALQEKEEFHRTVLEHSPLGISVRAQDGTLLSYNESWKKIWAYTEQDIDRDITRRRQGLQFEARDNYLGQWQSEVKRVYEEGGTLHISELDVEGFRPGSAKWVSQYFYAIKDEDGRVSRVVILTEDITARKLAEERLRESEQRFRNMLERLPDAVFVHCKGRIVFANSSAAAMLGAESVDQIIGHDEFDFIDPDYKDVLQQRVELTKTSDILPLSIQKLLRFDGTSIPVEAGTTSITYEWQRAAISVVRDISARFAVEEALRESEKRYRSLVETMPDGLSIQNANGTMTFVNDSLLSMLGYTREEMLGHHPREFLDARNQMILEEQTSRRRTGKVGRYELTWLDKRGNRVVTQISPAPLYGPDNSFSGSFAIISDITMRKQQYDSLRKHWQLLDGASTAASLLVAGGDIEQTLQQCLATVGFATSADRVHLVEYADKPIGGARSSDYEWVRDGMLRPPQAPDGGSFYQSLLVQWEENLSQGDHIARFRGRFPALEQPALDQLGVQSMLAVPILSGGQMWGYISIEDCTEPHVWTDSEISTLYVIASSVGGFIARATAQQALQSSEERLRLAVMNMPVMVTAVDESGRFIVWNRECERVTGYAAAEMLGSDDAFARLSAGDELRELLTQVGESDGDYRDRELEMTAKDSSARTVIWSSLSGQHPVPGWRKWSVGIEVTKRKQAEEALKTSEQNLRAIFENSLAGIVLTTVEGRVLQVNPRFARMLGYTDDELLGMDYFELLGSPEREKALANRDRVLQGCQAQFSFERTYLRSNGQALSCAVVASVFLNEREEPSQILFVMTDITERKRAEEERERLITELREALTQIKTLRGLLPICSYCKKIRDDQGYWSQLEAYITEHSEAAFSHGICPDCMQKHFPEMRLTRKQNGSKKESDDQPADD
ncbi:PAS domain S-box protein [bacterium]|nr:PAS domain S-box protein [bacterium]